MMKRFLYTLICLISAVSIFNSCEEEVDLVGDFQETAVIYGLLDKSDSVHFIKINRAFIGPGNSLEIAQIPDSNYFDQVDATITEVGGAGRVWTLKDTIVTNKLTDGVFYAPEQKLYYFTTSSIDPLNAAATYKLHVSINGGEFTVDGETELVTGITTTADPQSFRFEFADNPSSYVEKGLGVQVGNSFVVNTTLEVIYNEYTTPSTLTQNSFTWNLGETETEPNSTETFTISGRQFYELMANDAQTSGIIKRNMHSIKVIVTGGAEDFYNYMTVNKPASSLAQTKPTYTNLTVSEGHRVIGVFSSRYTYTVEKLFINPNNPSLRMMTAKTVQELCTGSITGLLLFCSQHPGDIGTTYDC